MEMKRLVAIRAFNGEYSHAVDEIDAQSPQTFIDRDFRFPQIG